MKVFFTASLRGQNSFVKHYLSIYKTIEQLGYTHLDDEIFVLKKRAYYQQIEKEGRKGYVKLYRRKMQRLQEADICVFECSLHSLSIGFLIDKALESNKPTIALYYKDNIPHFLAGIQEEKLIVKSYNEKNYKKVIKEFLKEAREIKDKRFNFFISPKLLSYIETISKEQGVTKSRFIRSLIVEHMRINLQKYKS